VVEVPPRRGRREERLPFLAPAQGCVEQSRSGNEKPLRRRTQRDYLRRAVPHSSHSGPVRSFRDTVTDSDEARRGPEPQGWTSRLPSARVRRHASRGRLAEPARIVPLCPRWPCRAHARRRTPAAASHRGCRKRRRTKKYQRRHSGQTNRHRPYKCTYGASEHNNR
jgi:hypothetical protein